MILHSRSYSGFRLVAEALRAHRGWRPAWRAASPKPAYEIVIVGGGGHGLATAYQLAKEHGLSNVAVLEKGAIGLGNVGRNTTIPLELFPARECALLRGVAEALGEIRAGAEL